MEGESKANKPLKSESAHSADVGLDYGKSSFKRNQTPNRQETHQN